MPEATIPWLMNNFYWGVRTTSDPAVLREAVRREVRAVDPDVPASMIRTMEEMMETAIAPRRTREIGIRAALGARPAQNLRVVIGDILRPPAAGLGAGVLAAIAGAPALRSMLFAVDPIAPLTMAGVSALLLVVGLAAALTAAWRLRSIDPIIALRAE